VAVVEEVVAVVEEVVAVVEVAVARVEVAVARVEETAAQVEEEEEEEAGINRDSTDPVLSVRGRPTRARLVRGIDRISTVVAGSVGRFRSGALPEILKGGVETFQYRTVMSSALELYCS